MDEIIIRFSVRDDGTPSIERVNKAIGKTKEQTQALLPGLEKARSSVTGFVSANAALIGILVGVGAALGKIVKSHLEYADAVRQQVQLSGTNAEAASRYLQVLDDYKIGTEGALAATRALTNAGHVPSIETLAKLSDEYLSITDKQKQNEFVLKNLGRGGADWVEVLNKGSAALLKQGQAVEDNLVLDQKALDDARKLQGAWDGLSDAVSGLGNRIGKDLTPILTEMVHSWEWATRIAMAWYKAVKDGTAGSFDFAKVANDVKNEILAQEKALLKNTAATNDNSSALGGWTDNENAAADAAKRLSDVRTGMLSAMFAITGSNKDYQKTLDDLAKSDQELADEKNKLTLKMWEEQRAGKLTNDEYLTYVQRMDEITKAQQDNAKAREEANDENKDAGKQRIYDLVQSKLAADGMIDSGEFEYLQNLAVSYGLVSRKAADQAIAEDRTANALVASLAKTRPAMDETLAMMNAINSYDGKTVNFGVNFSTSGSIPGVGMAGSGHAGGGNTSGGSIGGHAGTGHKRDSGGEGIAGTSYMIGIGAQPEAFIPSTNGTFIPNADKLGTTYIVNVYNPKRETAENSIRRSLKKLSFVGVAS